MAETKTSKKKKCVCSSRVMKLEDVVKELDSRLNIVEECLLGVGTMQGRIFHLEKSMESALDRIMPRLDTLLAGLPSNSPNQTNSKSSVLPPFSNAHVKSALRKNASLPVARPKPNRSCASASGSSCTSCNCSSHGCAPSNCVPAKRGETTEPCKTCGPAALAAGSSVPPTRMSARPASIRNMPPDCQGAEFSFKGSLTHEEMEKQLREAAANGNVVLCQKILLEGVDAKKRDPMTGDSALHCAARGGHLGCIMMLLAVAKNAVICTNKQLQTPLMVAAANDHVPAVQLLLNQCKPCWNNKQGASKALWQAASDGKHQVLHALLEGSVSPNLDLNATGPSPLHIAAFNGHAECVKILIDRGADIHHADNEGQTPLHKAANKGDGECIALLLAAGANPTLKDKNGWEPLHVAARVGNTECAKLLLPLWMASHHPETANGEPTLNVTELGNLPSSPQT